MTDFTITDLTGLTASLEVPLLELSIRKDRIPRASAFTCRADVIAGSKQQFRFPF